MTTPTRTKTKRAPHGPRPAVSWTTEIAHTRHRWWWYLVIGWIGWTGFFIAAWYGAWDIAVVVALAAAALIVINLGKPRRWTVTVRETSIRIQRPDQPKFDYELPLKRYNSFTVVEMPAGKRDRPQLAVALISRRRLGIAQLLVLPYDEHEADMLIQQLTDYIPYQPRSTFPRSDRILSTAAQWLGLS